jgi:hypothetical protein
VGHGRDEKCIQNLRRETLKGRDHSEDIGGYGRITVKQVIGILGGKV